jgi:hypothetical protein
VSHSPKKAYICQRPSEQTTVDKKRQNNKIQTSTTAVKIDESNESWVEVCRRSSKIKSSQLCTKLSMKAMAVEDNPHRYLDREIRYFDEQAAM